MNLLPKTIFIFSMLLAVSWPAGFARSIDIDQLRQSIDARSKELQEINAQIQATQKNISALEDKGRSLSQEIKKSDYLVSNLNLSIKSSQIKIDKLKLEIESLSYDINDASKEISVKREAIADFLRELQEKDRETTLVIFFKNQSLAQSLFEAQSINNLSTALSDEVGALEIAKVNLAEKLTVTTGKKQEIERENLNLKNRKSIVEDQKSERQELLRATKNQEQIYQEQLEELEKQQTEVAKEIEGIEKELRSQIDPNLLPIPRPGVLKWPVDGGRMSQGYGQTTFARYNYRGQHHNGVDIAAPLGTAIFAAEDGTVTATGNQDRYCPRAAYGKFIVVTHENGLTTLYAHLSQIAVIPNQKVERGQIIGYMGKSGWATGSHLHFTVWSTVTHLLRSTRVCGLMPVGGDLNPLDYLEKPPI